jgi:putative toxin-antitoxin system antitoxin component (TIGR02293 family)
MEAKAIHLPKKKSKVVSVVGRVLPGKKVTINEYVIILDSGRKPESHMTPMEKMIVSKSGVSKKDLVSLKQKTELDYDRLAKTLSVTRSTLINKKTSEKFSPTVSEKIVGLAEIYSYGYEVFEDKEKFNSWISRPNKALGGQAPFELLDSQFGREEVKNIIGRIEYGVYS